MKTLRLFFALALATLVGAPRTIAQGLVSDLTVQRTITLQGDISPAQITVDQDNYSPTGFATAAALRLNSSASKNITGLVAGADGRVLFVSNIGSFPIVLISESASSTAANRFSLVANFTLAPGGSTLLIYDSTSARWRQVFGAAVAGAGTVTSVNVTGFTGLSASGGPITSSGTIALSTTLSGVLKGTGTGFAVATAGSDYLAAGAVTTSGLTMTTARMLGRTTASTGAIEEMTAANVKTFLSLTNVENTALTTWTGSTSITSLGTIITGNWNSAAITEIYGGTAQSSYTAGDMLYASATNTLTKFATTTFGRSLLTQSTAAAANITLGTAFNSRVAKTGAYTVVAADNGVYFDTTSGTFTLALTAAATLGNSFEFAIFNSGSGVITIDPNSTETIRDAAGSATTKTLAQGEGGILVCDGAGWSFLKVAAGGGAVSLASATTNYLAYYSGASAVSGLATAASSILVTNGSSVPSFSTTLPSFQTTTITFGASGGTISGTSGSVALAATGTNQDVTATPSGSGTFRTIQSAAGGTSLTAYNSNSATNAYSAIQVLNNNNSNTNGALFFGVTSSAYSGAIIGGSPTPSGIGAFVATNGLYPIFFGANNIYALGLTTAGVVILPRTTASTTTGTGSLVVSGGVGIAGALFLDGASGKVLSYTNGTANGAVATVLGSVGPTGAATTVQTWLRVNIGGTDRYIPAFED